MRSKLLVLLLSLTLSNAVAQSLYPVSDINTVLKLKANAVIRDMETTIDMRTSGNVVQTVRKVVTIMNKNGDERASLAIFYNKVTSIKSIKGSIYDALGLQIKKFSLSDFKDESAINDFSLYEDDRVKHFSPSVLSYPYTIVYEYEIRYRQNLIIPDWDANPYPDVAVVHNSYTFLAKPEDKIRIKEYNFNGLKSEDKTKEQIIHKWSVSNISAFQKEPFSPDPELYQTSVKIAPENFLYYDSKGSYQDWQQLGKWIYNDLLKPRQNLSPQVVEEIKELVKDVEGDKNKAKKIYEYMQEKTRYVSVQIGIGGFQPINAAEVGRLGYGDCKGLVNYMQSLLKAVGIPSYYCIVYAGSLKKNLDLEYASMNQANHIVLCLPFERDTTWLECTNQDIPYGFLGDFTDDRIVLACTEAGGKLMRTPALTAEMNQSSRKANLNLDAKGSLSGSLQTVFTGSKYDNYDYLIAKTPIEQIKSLKKEYDIDNIDFTSMKFEQDKSLKPSTTENLKLTIDRYAPYSNNRMYLLVNAFDKVNTIPDFQNRTRPVYINRGYTNLDEFTYNIPEGYVIEAKPVDKDIKSAFGFYSVNVIVDERKIIYKRKLILNGGSWPAKQYAELVNFLDEANTSDQRKIVFITHADKVVN
jgi:transglutaminase-like putative cysteine protease